jgi:hypothetical protein
MKKAMYTFIVVIVVAALASVLITVFRTRRGEYQKIRLSGVSLGADYEETVTSDTKISFDNIDGKDNIPTKMPIYQIKYKTIDKDIYNAFKEFFGIKDEDIIQSTEFSALTDTKTIQANEDSSLIECFYRYDTDIPITYSDNELEIMAKEWFAKIPCINHEEYEYVGVASTESINVDGEDIPIRKRIAFRKIINGMRVIGDDQCDLYFNSKGFCGISIDFVEYEQIGEMDLIPFEDAKERIKTPDAFVLYNDSNTITGVAAQLKVERVKMLLVNQSSSGCAVLQPIYNFIGTAENETGSAEFNSRIIAIPDKYTFDVSVAEGELAG